MKILRRSLARAAPQLLDVLLCIFEVNEVCESPSMTSFDDCAHEIPLVIGDPPGTAPGPQEIFTALNPYGKYF
jgi:hypothetical protein